MDVVDLPLEQIIPYARNPRRNEQAIATVAASIQEFGWRQPIVVDEAMVVLAGHTRLEAARKLGFKTAPVHVAKGLTVSQARAFRIMDNRSSENAEWDKDLLNLELADLLEADFDLGLTGFTEDELNALMSSLDEGTGPQEGEDDIPETPEDPISRPGDLWILGNHQLLCGDSTVATDVERVLNGVKPLLLVSDPPYGVEYDPSWRNQAGAAKTKRTGKVLNDDRADWREAWALFPGDVAYVWHGALHAARGVEIREGVGLDRLLGDGRVSGARLTDGSELELDFVIVGVGITPETTLAEAAGVEIDNGIRTDEQGRTSVPGVWAAGDCASFPYRGERIRLESVPNAIDQAEVVAENIMGAGKDYVAKPWFWSDQYDVKLQIAGLNTGYDNVVTRDGGEGSVSFWYYGGETLLAVDAMNAPRDYMIGKRLIEAGKSPAPDVVENPETDLRALLRL